MKFGIDKISLWSLEGHRRDVNFKRNAVNVITGDSGTGKTAILEIFDYCFLASTHKISESIINENVSWYGICFYINEKTFLIARRRPTASYVSSEYYFSALAQVPDKPTPNISEADLRRILETEFGIGRQATIPFGGNAIRAGSRISFRYFFLFNTISQDIITNSEVFFDRQSEDRYREALPRIFDLALGIDSIDNIINREKKEEIEREIFRLRRKDRQISQRFDTFKTETSEIARKAAEYGLVAETELGSPLSAIRNAISTGSAPQSDSWSASFDQATGQLLTVNRQLRSAKRFVSEYSQYKSAVANAEDSLRPLELLIERSGEVVKTEHFDELISVLKSDLKKIRAAIASKTPVDAQLSELIELYENEREVLQEKLASLPVSPKSFSSEREKWIFIGEAKGKLDVYYEDEATPSASNSERIGSLTQEASEIIVHDVDERRELTLRMIEEAAQGLMTQVHTALENYATYQAVFNYKDKKLQLRKPKSSFIENVGSSSNHMFLHLFQFLALHEVSIASGARFVPSFLILDQPSRPYYGDEKLLESDISHSDTAKITAAFSMLDKFIDDIKLTYNADFQMIVFEHVPSRIWNGMKNVHLVEEFRHSNALVPADWLDS